MDISPESELLVNVMSAGHNMTNQINAQLIESLQSENDQLHAEIDLIIERIMKLVGGDFMPTSRAIRDALWPDSRAVQARAAGRKEARESAFRG